MRRILGLASLAMLACLGPAQQAAGADQPPEEAATLGEALTGGKLLLQLRPRWEYVAQDNKPEDANAYTMRTLLGWRTKPWHGLSVTAEGINVTNFDSQNFYDKPPPVPKTFPYPAVSDPDVTQINQLYGEYTGLPQTDIKVGWQAIKLDNLRFVGNVDFRQVMQVFDAAGIENKSIDKLSAYVAYLWRQRNIFGQQLGMQMPVVNLRYGWKPGNDLIGYAYLQNEARTGQNTGTGFANGSNQIYGLRANGAYPLGEKWKLLYTAEYAQQDSYADGNSLINADYYHLGIGAKWGEFFARVDQEMLGSNDGKYGFQTPLATLHLFQGWADQFTTTPQSGIRDTYLSAGAKAWKLLFYTELHKFKSSFGGFDLGNEFDVGITWPIVRWLTAKVEYADYHAGAGGPPLDTQKVDVQKFWLTLVFQF